jgi:AraC-like DNA-binding protein
MGTSPAKYRNELRLGKARDYLKFGDISVQEISDTLGYATVSHFIKEFKGKHGISPLQYRKSERG